jgi:hypothetical protein
MRCAPKAGLRTYIVHARVRPFEISALGVKLHICSRGVLRHRTAILKNIDADRFFVLKAEDTVERPPVVTQLSGSAVTVGNHSIPFHAPTVH